MDFIVPVIMLCLYYPVQIILGCWAVNCFSLVVIRILLLRHIPPAGPFTVMSRSAPSSYVDWLSHSSQVLFQSSSSLQSLSFQLSTPDSAHFCHFPERTEATHAFSSHTLSPRISPRNFIPSLVLFLPPLPISSETLILHSSSSGIPPPHRFHLTYCEFSIVKTNCRQLCKFLSFLFWPFQSQTLLKGGSYKLPSIYPLLSALRTSGKTISTNVRLM